VGLFTPKYPTGHVYILVTTDYFSKGAKVISLKEVKKKNVVDLSEHRLFINMVCLSILS